MKVQSLFIFPQCSPMSFLCPVTHGAHHITLSHHVSLDPLDCDFPCFSDLDGFEECWPNILQNVPRLGFPCYFSHG